MYRCGATEKQRAAFIILIDCSLSMSQPSQLGSLNFSKLEIANLICNLIIDELVERSRAFHRICHLYDLAVLGYSQGNVISLFTGEEPSFTPIDRLNDIIPMPTTIYNNHVDKDGTVQSVPITYHRWINAQASGSTPMFEALASVFSLADAWCHDVQNRYSFPPIVINITDGAANDSDRASLIDISKRIQSLHTEEGNALLFNVMLTSDPIEQHVLVPNNRRFKSNNRELTTLFHMSSVIPKELEYRIGYIMVARHRGPYRAVIKDFSAVDLAAMINTGTQSIHVVKYP